MTGYDLQLHMRYRNIIRNKDRMDYASREFYRIFLRGWANFSLAKKLKIVKIVSSVDKVVNFKDFSRPNKHIKHIWRT